jgi:hypothetical protein
MLNRIVLKWPLSFKALKYSFSVFIWSEKFNFKLLGAKRKMLYIRDQPYRAVNTFHQGYENQSGIDVSRKSRCLFWDPYKNT